MKSIIYVPSLGYKNINDTAKQYAFRLMKAIDENAPEAQNTYRVETRELQYDHEGNSCEAISLYETSDQNEIELYRIYEFAYSNFLTRRISESSMIVRIFTIFMILFTRSASVVRSFFNREEEVRLGNKFQAVYFAAFFSFIALYFLALLAGLFLSVAQSINTFLPAEAIALLPDCLISILDSAIAEIVTLSTLPVFSLFMLFTSGKKKTVSDMAATYVATHQYLSIGEQRNLIIGKLTKLIECIAEKTPTESDLEIHSYSFGSVIALDVLFPVDGNANTRVAKNITQLITIGCPFDFIEIYWKGYFSNRNFDNLELRNWFNVNAELDVLASKFENRQYKQKRFLNSDAFWNRFSNMDISYNIVNPERVSKFQALMFYGIRAHQMYWDQYNIDARSCLNPLVQRMSTAA
ncbi:MAG: hypothetical protein JXX14_09495 [Deltaproteobacteria bacterium]|nr:hypothetical protein [Deltaproteobacteria bacterium]